MNKILLIGLASILVAGCGSTSNVATQDVVANKNSLSECMRENYKEKENCVTKQVIANVGLQCKNTTVTGSRLPIRKCTTAAQREEHEANAALSVAKIQRGLQTTTTGETRMHNGF